LTKSGNIAGYFGKLPGFNDFVKYNAGGEELLVLDKWLQDGLLSAKMKLKSDWVNYYKNSDELFFFYPFTGTGRALSGLLFFSTDKSGREFPFIVFFYLDKKQLNNIPFHLIPMILFDILNELKSSFTGISSINNLSILNERINKISCTINNINDKDNLYQDYLSSTSQTDFWNKITDGYHEPAMLSFLMNLYLQKESTEPVTISFLSTDNHYLNDLSFLIQLTFTFHKMPDSFPGFFWTESENKSHLLHIFINKPLPDNFIDLIRIRDNNNLSLNERQSNTSIRSTFENLVNRDITLKEFLNAIH